MRFPIHVLRMIMTRKQKQVTAAATSRLPLPSSLKQLFLRPML
jgi:hypothetical protein